MKAVCLKSLLFKHFWCQNLMCMLVLWEDLDIILQTIERRLRIVLCVYNVQEN
jgi:hypothetical protein